MHINPSLKYKDDHHPKYGGVMRRIPAYTYASLHHCVYGNSRVFD
jgi:hypothetical protein